MVNPMQDYKINIPEGARYILDTLTSHEFESYVVGGCIRDSLLGLPPSDWDITTNALPEEVLECFNDHSVIPTGLKHGTVTLIIDSIPFEVTTYRIDGEYIDLRHPDTVTFTPSIKEDLARRDFTINAMAYSHSSGLLDFFGGVEDLKNKNIRCVGDPRQRFIEDALRIFRCVRLACQLGFFIEQVTKLALLELCENLNYVSKERIQQELNKSLLGDYFKEVFLDCPEPLIQIIPELRPMLGFNQNSPYHIYDVYKHTLVAVKNAHKNIIIRLSALLHDIGKPSCYTVDDKGVGHFKGHQLKSVELSKIILNRLRYSNETKCKVLTLVEYHDIKLSRKERNIKRWLNILGEDTFRDLLLMQTADAKAKNPKFGAIQLGGIYETNLLIDKIIKEKQCFSLADLNIKGSDLIRLGIKEGPQVGSILNRLMDLVIEGELSNTKDGLTEKAAEFLETI